MADAEKLVETDTLKKAYPKINVAIDNANEAKHIQDGIQEQINTLVINGDSSPAAAQAAVDAKGIDKGTLKKRLDDDYNEVTTQLAQIVTLLTPSMTSTQIQNLLNNGGSFKFTKGTYNLDFLIPFVTPTCLDIQSNTKLEFEKGTILTLPPNSLDTYYILQIVGKDNVTIIGGKIQGERVGHTGSTGEWGYGIRLVGSTNVRIDDTIITNCWGDGISIGNVDINSVSTPCKGIYLNHVICDNNRRQGISVGGVDGLYMDHCRLINTNGTAPASGIDFEPDIPQGILRNIYVNDLYTENNQGVGVSIVPGNLDQTSAPISIHIKNHSDKGSNNGVLIVGVVGKQFDGIIEVINPYYQNNVGNGVRIYQWDVGMPAILIDKPTVYNCNTSGQSGLSDSAAISTFVNIDSGGTMGNITINEPSVIENRASKLMTLPLFVQGKPSTLIKKYAVLNPKRLDPGTLGNGAVTSLFYCNASDIKIEDKNDLLVLDLSNTLTDFNSNVNNYAVTVTDKNMTTGQGWITFNTALPFGTEFTFKVLSGRGMIINPVATENIVPLSQVVGKQISSTTIGSTIRIRKISSTSWLVLNMTGTWNVQA